MIPDWAAGTVLFQLALRDFRQRYVGSMLGWLWGLVHPLVLLGVYTFLFSHAFGARLPPEESTGNYPLFLLAGLLPWLLLSETLTRSVTSLTEHSTLIKKSVFPSEAIPASILASTAFAHLLSLVVLVIAAAFWGHRPTVALALLPLYVVAVSLFTLGLAWIAAGLHVYLRDVAQVLSVGLTAWFWLTPVFLPESFYRGRLDVALDWNPVRFAVSGYRQVILGGGAPSLAELGCLLAFATAAFGLGAIFFRRAKKGFPDVM